MFVILGVFVALCVFFLLRSWYRRREAEKVRYEQFINRIVSEAEIRRTSRKPRERASSEFDEGFGTPLHLQSSRAKRDDSACSPTSYTSVNFDSSCDSGSSCGGSD